jgi:arabinofuranan 3-O-arabinosyltransferase
VVPTFPGLHVSRTDGPAGRRSAVVLWPLAGAFLTELVLRTYLAPRNDVDFRALYGGAQRFADGRSVYTDPFFLLSPSGLLTVSPFGYLSHDAAFALWNTVSIAAALVGWACAVRFAGFDLRGPVAAGSLLALCFSEALVESWMFGNLNNSLLLALGAGYLLAEKQDRRVLAGVLLGLSLAVKPVLLLVVVLPLLRRQWSTAAWAVAVPALANLVGILVTPDPGDFFRITVPALVHARPNFNASIWAVGRFLGAPDWVSAGLRCLVLAVALAAVWRSRDLPDRVHRLAVGYGLLLLATFLSASLSERYYSILLLPPLLALVRPGRGIDAPLVWLAAYLFGGPTSWRFANRPELTAFMATTRAAAGWLLLMGVLVAAILRQTRAAGGRTAGVAAPPAAGETPAARETPGADEMVLGRS